MKAGNALSAALLIAATVLLMVGCGGDSSSDTGTLSKHQFLKQANAICKESVDEQVAGFQTGLAESRASQASGNTDQKKLQEIVTKPIYRVVQEMINEVSAIGLPAGDEAAARKVIAEFEAALKMAEAHPAVYLTGKAFKRADEAADAYGMNDCGV